MNIKLIVFVTCFGLTVNLQASSDNKECPSDSRNRQIDVIQQHLKHLIALEASKRSEISLLQEQTIARMQKECLQAHRIARANACGLKPRSTNQRLKQRSGQAGIMHILFGYPQPCSDEETIQH